MIAALGAGALAGYAIAIPVGAIAVLIVEMGVRRGFWIAAAAGAGTATADLTYASVAMAGGAAIGPALAPWTVVLRVVAIVVLLAIGLRGLSLIGRAALRSRPDLPSVIAAPGQLADAESARRPTGIDARLTYGRFLGLTLLNPATIVYFGALVVALPVLEADPLARPAFVVGAFLASLSWQTVLAATGAIAHHRLPPRFQVGIGVLGNLMICGFAVTLARGLVAS